MRRWPCRCGISWRGGGSEMVQCPWERVVGAALAAVPETVSPNISRSGEIRPFGADFVGANRDKVAPAKPDGNFMAIAPIHEISG